LRGNDFRHSERLGFDGTIKYRSPYVIDAKGFKLPGASRGLRENLAMKSPRLVRINPDARPSTKLSPSATHNILRQSHFRLRASASQSSRIQIRQARPMIQPTLK
jgi:hypothetical protein